jgi:NDP-sugar pyrophosphorylase family protein
MDIIIPMAGRSERFFAAGYRQHKWMLELGGELIIAHVIKMFSPDDTFHLVLNTKQAEDIPDVFDRLKCLASKLTITVIEPHDFGPTFSALQVEGIEAENEIIIAYCDGTCEWNYQHFLWHARGNDGGVPAFRGFHPASCGSTYYAYIRSDGDKFQEIREKRSFTENRMNECASVGVYYFSSWKLFQTYAKKALDDAFKKEQESYISLVYNYMVKDDLRIIVHEVNRFICLGTPEDVQQYFFWWDYFYKNQNHTFSQKLSRQVKCINMMPIVEEAVFAENAESRLSAALIPIQEEPVAVRVARSLPDADRWTFLPYKKYLSRYPLELAFKKFQANCTITPLDQSKNNLASVCLHTVSSFADEDELLIASCDSDVRYDAESWQRVIDDSSVDGAVWAFRMGSALCSNFSTLSYCKLKKDGKYIEEVLDNQTISENPNADNVAVGHFWFRESGALKNASKSKLESHSEKRENWLLRVINDLIQDGAKIKMFEVEQWVNFRDPLCYKVFNFWEDYFFKAERPRLKNPSLSK